MGTALVKNAHRNVPYTALLLSNHTDMLCGIIIQDVNLEVAVVANEPRIEDTRSLASDARPDASSAERSKRTSQIQPSRGVNKAART